MTTSDIRYDRLMAILPETVISVIVEASVEASERASKRTARILIKHALGQPLTAKRTECELSVANVSPGLAAVRLRFY
jgi:hypothetical protein